MSNRRQVRLIMTRCSYTTYVHCSILRLHTLNSLINEQTRIKEYRRIFVSFIIITWKRELGGFFFISYLTKWKKKSKKNKWACSFIREFRVCTLYIRQIVLHMFVKVFKCIVLKESQLNIHFDKLISNIPKEKYNSLNFHALHILYSL